MFRLWVRSSLEGTLIACMARAKRPQKMDSHATSEVSSFEGGGDGVASSVEGQESGLTSGEVVGTRDNQVPF